MKIQDDIEVSINKLLKKKKEKKRDDIKVIYRSWVSCKST